jgi:hypothetical protein
MKYTLIKGNYHVVGQSPDADSIKFRADNPALWEVIDTENRAAFTQNFTAEAGVITLRLEGVDALETHYTAPAPTPAPGTTPPAEPLKAGSYSQPSSLGRLSADKFLEFLGFTGVKWRTFGKSVYVAEATVNGAVIKTKLADPLPGYIVTGDIEKNGRPVAWSFNGTTPLADGSAITPAQLGQMAKASANYHLIKQGLVYPFYFMTLPAVARAELTKAAKAAQKAAAKSSTSTTPNVWRMDQTLTGVTLSSLRVLTEERPVFPYLFRKLVKHYQQAALRRGLNAVSAANESIPLDGFFNDANPHIFVVSEQDFLRLDDVVEANGNIIRMRVPPYDVVFLS